MKPGNRTRRTRAVPSGNEGGGRALLARLEKPGAEPGPVYLFAGDNIWLRDMILARLKDVTVPSSWQSTNVETLWAGEAGEAELADLARTPPFGSPKRMIIVRGVEAFRADKKGRAKRAPVKDSPLAEYARSPSPETVLALTAERSAMDRWEKDCLGKAVAGSGELVVCTASAGQELRLWVEEEAGRQGVKAEPAAISELIDRCGQDSLVLKRELEKLASYSGHEGSISVTDVAALTGERVPPDVFEFLDALFVERSPGHALRLLGKLLEDSHPLELHALMLTQVRKLVMLKEAAARGMSQGQIAGTVKLPFSLVPRLRLMVTRTSGSRFAYLLRTLGEAEFKLKRTNARYDLDRSRREREVMERIVVESCA